MQKQRNTTPEGVARARELRQNMSKSEIVLWNLVRAQKLGFRFRRQHPIGPYILDFYCPSAKLCVEVDGPHHADRRAQDSNRDAFLRDMDILTVRISTADFFEVDAPGVYEWAERLKQICTDRSEGRRTPSVGSP